MVTQIPRPKALVCLGLVVLAYCYVAIITLHLYKQFMPNYDLLLEAENARALLHKGEIPVRGSVSGYLAFNPPGVSWALVPGVLLFPTEAALGERVPALLLMALTLAGVYLLIAPRFGAPAAMCACLVFALSANGFAYADWRWNRAHPAFLIWFLYFAAQWVERRRPLALAWALTIWAASNYWMLEGIMFIVVLPLAWIAFRPPIGWRHVLLGIGLGGLIWSPYLAFEAKRNFVDLRANASRTDTITDYEAAFHNSLSDRGLKTTEGRRQQSAAAVSQVSEPAPEYRWVHDPQDGLVYQAVKETVKDGIHGRWTYVSSLARWVFKVTENPWVLVLRRAGKIWKLLLLSMPDSRVPESTAVLLFLLVASVCWAFSASVGKLWRRAASKRWSRVPVFAFALLFFAGGLWAVHIGPELFGLDRSEGVEFLAFWLLSLAGLSVSMTGIADRFFTQASEAEPGREKLQFVLAAAAFVPWALQILLMVNDNSADQARRFLWLWAAQGALMVIFLFSIRWGQAIRVCSLAALILLVGLNATSIDRTLSWYRYGFRPAPSSDFNNIVDFLGRRIRAEGRTSASIGYDLPFLKWAIVARVVDGVSKIGRQYDVVLQTRYGVTNLDSTAEGVSRNDEFRIVEYSSVEPWRQTYFDLSDYPQMTQIYSSACCAVLQRSDLAALASKSGRLVAH